MLQPIRNYVREVVIPVGIAGIQATWMYFGLPSMALDTRFPSGYDTHFGIAESSC